MCPLIVLNLVKQTNSCLLIKLLLVIILSSTLSNSASFYGHSYLRLPLQEAKNSTQVEFRFKTHQQDAFLFLAAGSSDYCLIYLEKGQLAVKMNMGSGETYLVSDDLRLDDLVWHSVRLHQIGTHLSLVVDQRHKFTHQVKITMESVLNIRYGVFLGGQDTFKGLYLGNIPTLRGCLEQVYFNHRNVIESSLKQGILHNVRAEGCDEEFATSANTTISFTRDDSFVKLPGWWHHSTNSSDKPLVIQLELKTISNNAMVLFTPGLNPYRRQYLALEIIDGRLKTSLSDTSGETEVYSMVSVDDSHWHHIEIRLDSTHLVIQVDGKVDSSDKSGIQLHTDQYADEVYIGGISTSRQSVALNWRLQSVLLEPSVSLKGCVRNIRFNGRFAGLFDAIATHHVRTGKCRWQFLCADRDRSPCMDQAECLQSTYDSIICACSESSCVKSSFKHKSIVAHSQTLSICQHRSKPIDVLEGTSVVLDHKTLTTGLPELHLDLSELELKAVKPPRYGSIEVLSASQAGMSRTAERSYFRYTHDGSAHYADVVILQVKPNHPPESISTDDSCDRYLLTLPIVVRSPNDAPKIKQKNTITIRVIKNSKTKLTFNLFKAKHKESKLNKKFEEILYRVVHVSYDTKSHLELTNQPNVQLQEFTENDLRAEKVQFVHVVNPNEVNHKPVEVTLFASSGNSLAIEREWRLVFEPIESEKNHEVNTGLQVAHRAFALVTTTNLSYSVGEDVGEKSGLIRYELVSGPMYGAVQKLRAPPNHWVNVSQFTQRQIDRGKIRYIHLVGKPLNDSFVVSVSVHNHTLRQVEVPVHFVDRLVIVSRGTGQYSVRENDKEVILTKEELSFQTTPLLSIPRNIHYTLLSVPLTGELYLLQEDGLQAQAALRVFSNFTQQSVDENRLLYVRNVTLFEGLPPSIERIDLFNFTVSVLGSNVSQQHSFQFIMKNASINYNLINRKLRVLEGGSGSIDEQHLTFSYMTEQPSDFEDITFVVKQQPKHGTIQILSPDLVKVIKTTPTQLPQSLIKQRRVLYVHDDSENDFDYFEFVVMNLTNHAVTKGKFVIEVEMKNDQLPVRQVNRVFHMVQNGERPLLASDLRFVDPDLNTPSSSLVYTRFYIPNGNVYFHNGSLAEKFTQEDIDNGLIKIRHVAQPNGTDHFKANFWVTDGGNYTSGVLEVQVSEPYITVTNNTGIVVKYGENALITLANLSVETNLPSTSDVIFKLTSEPMFGQVLINDKTSNQFTLKELREELVEYESTVFEDEVPTRRNDSFEFRVLSNNSQYAVDISPTHYFNLRIYPQSYFNLNVINLKNLTVFEESQVTIDSKTLRFEHSELDDTEIVYQIVVKPEKGVIKNLKNLPSTVFNEKSDVVTFSQQDINEGYIVYQNVRLDLADGSWDSLVFNVGSDIFRLTNLTCFIEVIPKLIILYTNNVTVNEGNVVAITNQTLFLSHQYYEKLVDEIIVVEQPKYGSVSLQDANNVTVSAKSFTLEQLHRGEVCYQHDSSELNRDWFTVVARSNLLERESLPATVHIEIHTINDEAPLLHNHTEAQVWPQESLQITNAHLAASDEDSPLSEVLYLVSMPINGYLINLETNTTIDRFSQREINSGKVYFVHVGPGNGSFRFHLTDGKNQGVGGLFRIRVKNREMRVSVNQKLLVAPGMQQSITRSHLQVTTNEDEEMQRSRQFTYRIIKAPSYGRVLLDDFRNHSARVNAFTQDQLYANLVVYDQNEPVNRPVTTDRIVFEIDSPQVPTLKNVHFVIEIAFGSVKDLISDDIGELVHIRPLCVEEGKFGTITESQIDLSQFLGRVKYEEQLYLKIPSFPQHGLLLRNGAKLPNETVLPVGVLVNHSVVYVHDDSNTFNDSIIFTVLMQNGFLISIINFTLPIEITPVNDEFPIVITRNPRLGATFGTRTLLTNEVLCTRDNDGNLSQIIYQLRYGNNSRDGYFMLHPKDTPVYYFTQADVTENKIYFVHSGHGTLFHFWFRVKDHESVLCEESIKPESVPFGQVEVVVGEPSHCTSFYPLLVTISHLALKLVNQTAIQLLQGSTRVPITRVHLATASQTTTPEHIVYKVKKAPVHGQLEVEERGMQAQFTQQQIDGNLVYYVQSSMSIEDYFIVDIVHDQNLYNEKPIFDVNVKIISMPLIKALRPFLVAHPGEQSLLSLEFLDASELLARTHSNPIFTLVTEPKYGKFKRLRYGDPDSNRMVTTFTNEDIAQNRIIYEANSGLDLSYPNEMLIDVIDYELSATGVPSAHGILVVNVLHNHSMHFERKQFNSSDHIFSAITLYVSKEQMFIIISTGVLLILILSLIAIIRISFYLVGRSDKTCHKNDSIKTLPRNVALENSSREHSNSTRPNDSSSHCSLASVFDTHLVHSDQLTNAQEQLESAMAAIRGQRGEYIPEHRTLRTQHHWQMDSGERADISPLPPPSLYFINESSGQLDYNQWNAKTSSVDKEMPKEPSRSSGDGTSSISHAPYQSKCVTTLNKSHTQLTNLGELHNYVPDETTFCTLDNRRFKNKSHSHLRNQYWI